MRSIINLSLIVVLSLGMISPLFAVPVNIYGDMGASAEGLGYFEGYMDYTYTAATSTDPEIAQLVIELTNLTPAPATSSQILRVSFNNPGNQITGAALVSAPANFVLNGGSGFQNGINENTYGKFDIGATVASQSNQGIVLGDTGTFTFNFSGTGLSGLTTDSFIQTLSEGVASDNGAQFLLVRFQRIDTGEGSDKVPGQTNENPVPEPMTMLLFGPALLGLVGFKRKKS